MKMEKKLYSCVNEFLVMEMHQFWEGVSVESKPFYVICFLDSITYILFGKECSLKIYTINDCIMSRLKRDVEKMIDICGQLSLPGEADKVS
jgi:hypothetical protein